MNNENYDLIMKLYEFDESIATFIDFFKNNNTKIKYIEKQDLYNLYKEWCLKHNIKIKTINLFSNDIKKRYELVEKRVFWLID